MGLIIHLHKDPKLTPKAFEGLQENVFHYASYPQIFTALLFSLASPPVTEFLCIPSSPAPFPGTMVIPVRK